jgi:transcriptional regulator ATRX
MIGSIVNEVRVDSNKQSFEKDNSNQIGKEKEDIDLVQEKIQKLMDTENLEIFYSPENSNKDFPTNNSSINKTNKDVNFEMNTSLSSPVIQSYGFMDISETDDQVIANHFNLSPDSATNNQNIHTDKNNFQETQEIISKIVESDNLITDEDDNEQFHLQVDDTSSVYSENNAVLNNNDNQNVQKVMDSDNEENSEAEDDQESVIAKKKIFELMKLDNFLSTDEDDDKSDVENAEDVYNSEDREDNLSLFQIIPSIMSNINQSLKDNEKKTSKNSEIDENLINNLCNVDGFLKSLIDQKNVRNEKKANANEIKYKKSYISESEESCVDEDKMDINTSSLNDSNFKNNILIDVKEEILLNNLTNYTYYSDDDDNLSMDSIICIEDGDKKDPKQNNNRGPTRGQTTKIYPILSPIRLNLLKSPTSQKSSRKSIESSLKIENVEEIKTKDINNDYCTSISGDEDLIKRSCKSTKRVFQSDEEGDDEFLKETQSEQEDKNDNLSSTSNIKKEKETKKRKGKGKGKKRKAKNAKKSKKMLESDDDNLNNLDEANNKEAPDRTDNDISINAKTRKIRKIIEDSKLKPETLLALEQEADRVRRLESQKKSSQMQAEEDKYRDLYLDNAKLLKINRSIGCHLKDYQINGVKFMYENCYESVEATIENYQGGCILGTIQLFYS